MAAVHSSRLTLGPPWIDLGDGRLWEHHTKLMNFKPGAGRAIVCSPCPRLAVHEKGARPWLSGGSFTVELACSFFEEFAESIQKTIECSPLSISSSCSDWIPGPAGCTASRTANNSRSQAQELQTQTHSVRATPKNWHRHPYMRYPSRKNLALRIPEPTKFEEGQTPPQLFIDAITFPLIKDQQLTALGAGYS